MKLNIRCLGEKEFNVAMLIAVLLILVVPVGLANFIWAITRVKAHALYVGLKDSE